MIGDGTVVRVDPATGDVDRRTTPPPRGSEPEGLAYDGRSVWVVDQAGDRLLPLDPATGRIGAPVDVGIGPRPVTAGAGSGRDLREQRRRGDGDPGGRRAADDPGRYPCLTPQGLAEAAGVVWVAGTADSRVVGLDARTLRRVTVLPDPASADAVVADGRSRTTENVGATLVHRHLWVSHPEAGRLSDVPLAMLGG